MSLNFWLIFINYQYDQHCCRGKLWEENQILLRKTQDLRISLLQYHTNQEEGNSKTGSRRKLGCCFRCVVQGYRSSRHIYQLPQRIALFSLDTLVPLRGVNLYLRRATAFKQMVFTRLAPKYVLEEERFKLLEKIYTQVGQWASHSINRFNNSQNIRAISIACDDLYPSSLLHNCYFSCCWCRKISFAIKDKCSGFPIF